MLFLFDYSICKRFPFNATTPITFSAAIILEYVYVFNMMITTITVYMIGIGMLPVLFPLTDDIKRDLMAIQQSFKDKRRRSEMAKPMSQFIQFHSDTRQLSV